MESKPLVSVVMPVYNSEKYIQKAIDSILNQSYENIELITVVDSPTDGTGDILSAYKDKRLKIFYNKYNKGISYSTNRGIDLSVGKYIALMDDDDISIHDRIQLQVDYLEEHEEIDILGGANSFIDAEGNMVSFPRTPRNNPKYIKATFLFHDVDFYNGSMMLRKSFLDENHLRCREDCYGIQDLWFYMECSKVGQISALNKHVLCYRIHEENETHRRMGQFAEQRKAAYAQCQRLSWKLSGFVFTEQQLDFMNRVLAEDPKSCCVSREELIQLYNVFSDMLQQAKIMEIDYYDELKSFLKKIFAQQIQRMDIFRDELIKQSSCVIQV